MGPTLMQICGDLQKSSHCWELFLCPPSLAATLWAIAGATSTIVPDDFFVWAAENGFK